MNMAWTGREVKMSMEFISDFPELVMAIDETSHWVINFRMVREEERNKYLYVGRPTKWGNPFILSHESERENVLRHFIEWLMGQPGLQEDARKELPGEYLGCWCHPKMCHAHVWSAIANGGLRL